MTDVIDRTTAPTLHIPYVQWGPVIAGALAAAALATVLHTFAGAIGLAVTSTAPTWRDASIALWILSGLYLVLVALAAYGLGGYVAGRLRGRLSPASPDEIEFRDGVHGLLVWAIATLLSASLLLAAASAATRLAAPSGGSIGPATSVAGENIVAFDLDRLFRGERRGGDADVAYTRAEAARILLTSSSHSGVTAEDRSYLIRLVAARTGLGLPDAERRTDDRDLAREGKHRPRAAQHRHPGVYGGRRGSARRRGGLVCRRGRRPAPGRKRPGVALDHHRTPRHDTAMNPAL